MKRSSRLPDWKGSWKKRCVIIPPAWCRAWPSPSRLPARCPGVLILDEVLSVGDRFFREKSEKRIRELISGGTAVLIVSHSTTVLRRICSRVLWIEKGELRMDGAPDAVCLAYEKRK